MAGGLEKSTAADVSATVSAADRRPVRAVPRAVVHSVAIHTVRQTKLIYDARLPSGTAHRAA